MENSPEPQMNIIGADGTTFEAVRENTTLFTHLGRLACFDHVFIHTHLEFDDDEQVVGTYVFRENDQFAEMENYMFENDYPMILNRLVVADCDRLAWENMVTREIEYDDLDDGVPEEWK